MIQTLEIAIERQSRRDRSSTCDDRMFAIDMATARESHRPDRLTTLLKSYPEGGALTMIIRPDDTSQSVGFERIYLDGFKHDTALRTDLRIKHLSRSFSIVGYAVYLQILEEFCKSGTLSLVLDEYWLIEDYADDLGLNSADEFLAIIQKLIEVNLLDSEPWESRKTLFSSEFIRQNQAEINRKIRHQQAHLYRKHQEFVFRRDGFKCVYCGCMESLSLDHVFPLSRGGGNDPDNLVTACLPCNLSKNDRTPEEWMGGGV